MDVCLLWVLCVLSGRGLCDGLITRPEESYQLWCVTVCDLGTSRVRRLKLIKGCKWRIEEEEEEEEDMFEGTRNASFNVYCWLWIVFNFLHQFDAPSRLSWNNSFFKFKKFIIRQYIPDLRNISFCLTVYI
jgi:hypothetical protein